MASGEPPEPVTDPEDPDPPRERITVAEDLPPEPRRPPVGHTHAGLRGLRYVLLSLAVGILAGYVVAVTTYVVNDHRFTVLEDYLGVRREATDTSRSRLEVDLRQIVCGLLAGRPADGGPEDELRLEYDCPPATAVPPATAPASSPLPTTGPAPATGAPTGAGTPPTASTRSPPGTTAPTTTAPAPAPTTTPAPAPTPPPTTDPPATPPADPDPGPAPGLVCSLLPLPILCQ